MAGAVSLRSRPKSSSPSWKATIAREILARKTALMSFPAFTERLGFKQAAHHRLLSTKLESVERGAIKRLMVFMPPGAAKSTYANVLFTAWYLGRNPERSIIAASYGQELADKFGRRARNILGSADFAQVFDCGLSGDNAAANRWATGRGGEYLATGVGGAVTGNRADGAIIDDPVKGREEASSALVRERTKDWYRDDLWTRLKPGAWIVLIMTRWHEDDLAGWLLAEQDRGGERWEVLRLPALAEADDPLGREVGEALWPEWFTSGMFAEAQRDQRRWSALYQQRPAPEAGDYFDVSWLRSYTVAPSRETLTVYGASDYAVTASGGDYTVHVVVGVDPDDRIYLLDLWRDQSASDRWIEAFCDLVLKWKPLGWAEETGQIRASLGPFLDRRQIERSAYVARTAFPTRGDKAVRAQSIRGRAALGGLYLPTDAPWRSDLVAEMMSFPAGVHDDQVDALGLVGQLLDKMVSGARTKAPAKPETHDGYAQPRTGSDDHWFTTL